MAMSPMKLVGEWRRFKLYYAAPNQYFTYPGYHLWTGKRHIRVFPLRNKKRAA